MSNNSAKNQTESATFFSLRPRVLPALALALLILLALSWPYASTFAYFMRRWSIDAAYSHGYLVPIFSLVILWYCRPKETEAFEGSSWWALVALAITVALYVGGTFYYFTWFVQISLLPAFAAVSLALGGWQALRWMWPAILYLMFMIPLPARLDHLLAAPLQRCATLASTNALQTLGFFAHPEGNVILMSQGEVGVVEACSGLRMLMVFFAASTAVVIIQRRSPIQTGLILLSAVPIALFCNVLRITCTGALQETVESQAINHAFHDLAGWLMIPLSLLLLAIELWFLSHLFLPKKVEDPKRQSAPRPAFGLADAAPKKVLTRSN